MRRKDVVVAWYTEDLGWLDRDDSDAIVYAKDKTDASSVAGTAWRFVSLPNVGREGHTYLRHIVDHYDDLADLTVFLQGDPSPHMKERGSDAVAKLGIDDVAWYTNVADEHMVEMNDLACKFWLKGADLTKAMYVALFESPVPETASFGAGAMFAVTREAIRFRSLAFWRLCLAFVDNGIDPAEVYSLERLWPLIFDPSLKARR